MSAIATAHSRKKNHEESAHTRVSPFIFILAGVLLAAGIFSIQLFLSSSYFKIKEVRWSGIKQMDENALKQQFQFVLGQNLIHLSITDIHTALLANRWIKEAVVQKVFPGRIDIALTERVPAAVEIDPLSNRMVLRDGEGVVLEEGSQENLPRIVHYNPDTYTKSLELAPLLSGRKDALIDLSDSNDVAIHLKKGGTTSAGRATSAGVLHLGDKDIKKRWERFTQVESDLNRKDIAPWEADLRFPSQVVVKTKTAAVDTE